MFWRKQWYKNNQFLLSRENREKYIKYKYIYQIQINQLATYEI